MRFMSLARTAVKLGALKSKTNLSTEMQHKWCRMKRVETTSRKMEKVKINNEKKHHTKRKINISTPTAEETRERGA